MITKEKAITLFENYLETEYNVDPLLKTISNKKAHRSSIAENDNCWMIHRCTEEEMHQVEFIGDIGVGPYYIDKSTGEIYSTGSAPHIQFEKEFILFKTTGQSLLDWFPLKSEYLDAKPVRIPSAKVITFPLLAKYETRATEIKTHLLNNFEPQNLSKLKLVYKPIDGIDCLIDIKSNEEEITETPDIEGEYLNVVSLEYIGGFNEFYNTLSTLKKWIRVNQKKLTDQYWIGIAEDDFSKDFNDWKLTANLAFINY